MSQAADHTHPELERRLDRIADQLSELIGGMARLELRVSLVEQRLGTMDQRIAGVEQRLSGIEQLLRERGGNGRQRP